MKKIYSIVMRLSVLIVVFGGLLGMASKGHAQSTTSWSSPTNLSNSGFASNPLLVIDSTGTLHVMWIDKFDGYKYTKSTDGVTWSPPKNVRFPFLPDPAVQPVLLADQNGGIHALWRTIKNELLYSKVVTDVDVPSRWTSTTKLADLVIAFDAAMSSQGNLHVGFVTTSGVATSTKVTTDLPAGVHYRQLKGFNWSISQNLYSSQYLRSLTPDQANIHVAVSDVNGAETVYAVWDDRPQKRLFMSRSLDGGIAWESPIQVRSSEDSAGLEAPFNINVDAVNGQVLLLWQSGVPGGNCAQYGQWSVDGGVEFQPPVRMPGILNGCPQVSNFLIGSNDLSIVWLNILDDISLIAWKDSGWSEPQPQSEVTTFTHPVTFDNVFYGCQKPVVFNGQLYVVGCDKGSGGDIWFSSRTLGTVEDWFPPAWAWTAPVEVTTVTQQLSTLSSAADSENNIHTFWVQTELIDGVERASAIHFSRANGESWSSPVNIISEVSTRPSQLNVIADPQSRLLLTWVDRNTGDLFFSWAQSGNADKPSEWTKPQYIPSASQTNSSPDILADASGKIIIVYAVPLNEQRGIYFVETGDAGLTWSQPIQIFDAASAGWGMVDHPKISLTGDGRLHMLFNRYIFQEENRQSQGLYYSQSADGGITWTDPEVVSEHPVLWSDIVGFDRSILHRLWQERRQGMLVSFHQTSADGGITWSSPVILSSIKDNPSMTVQTIDRAGNLYFLQMSTEDHLTILEHMWNGSGWSSPEPKEFFIKDRATPTSITVGASSQGNLLLSVLVTYPDLTGQPKSGILSLGKTLQLSQDLPDPAPALLPASEPAAVLTESVSDPVQSSTQNSPMSDLNRTTSSRSKNRNLVGFLLLGGIVVLLIVIFRPLSRIQTNPKKTSE